MLLPSRNADTSEAGEIHLSCGDGIWVLWQFLGGSGVTFFFQRIAVAKFCRVFAEPSHPPTKAILRLGHESGSRQRMGQKMKKCFT